MLKYQPKMLFAHRRNTKEKIHYGNKKGELKIGVMEEIKQKLIDLGFRISSSGILYWLDAFQYIKVTPKTYKMMEIYEAISLKRNKSVYAIERAMRYTLEPAKEKIQQKYNYYKNIDNMTFINLIRFEKE